MVSPRSGYYGDFDARSQGHDFVVNPAKIFGESEDFSIGSWIETLSNQGMLRVNSECSYGPSGIQGTIGMANPPSDDMKDMWGAAKPPGIWDYYGMLGFIQIPHPNEYVLQVFFIDGSFFEKSHEIICTISIEFPKDYFDEDGSIDTESLIQTEWAHIYRELFVKHFDAESLAGHYWPTCPCDKCSSSNHEGICSTPM